MEEEGGPIVLPVPPTPLALWVGRKATPLGVTSKSLSVPTRAWQWLQPPAPWCHRTVPTDHTLSCMRALQGLLWPPRLLENDISVLLADFQFQHFFFLP